jgi:hypothetical protein
MEQIKSKNNFKTIVIMETKINLDKPINLSIINTKSFVLWFKQEIKNLVEDQKISKRDRKDRRHPCPEKRKYQPLEAYYRVFGNRDTLRSYYALYYTLRHYKDIDWADFSFTISEKRWSKYEWHKSLFDLVIDKAKPIDHNLAEGSDFSYDIGDLVVKYVKEVINEGAEKALCNY